jgi:hypothetical protein
MIGRSLALLALAWAGAAVGAGPAPIPFVGCPSDGQQGPQRAPASAPHGSIPAVPAAAAPQLAYYASNELGVLAPRGWHCIGLEGSDGSFLFVTPDPHDAAELLRHGVLLRGPAVQLGFSFGGTSGRFEVARVIALAFPAHMAFARRVAAEGFGDPLPAGPYSTDHMVRLRPNAVGYTTPAGHAGLGTGNWLAPGDRPIDGLAVLDPELGSAGTDMDVTKIDVRLPAAQAGLARAILNAVLPPRRARR